MRHHAIVVTSYDGGRIDAAHANAVVLGCHVSAIDVSAINSYYSFCIMPDGSKEGWAASDEGDFARDKWKEWADAQRYEDGSSPLAWVEVQYGDDNDETAIVAHSDEPHRLRTVTG